MADETKAEVFDITLAEPGQEIPADDPRWNFWRAYPHMGPGWRTAKYESDEARKKTAEWHAYWEKVCDEHHTKRNGTR